MRSRKRRTDKKVQSQKYMPKWGNDTLVPEKGMKTDEEKIIQNPDKMARDKKEFHTGRHSNSCDGHHHLAHHHHCHYHHVAGQIGEGEVGPLLTVSATDQDCSPSLGKVNASQYGLSI